MENNTQQQKGGVGFFGILTILFTALKLTGYIDWSWWWVTAPLWFPIPLVLVLLFVFGCIGRVLLWIGGVK